MKTRLTLEEKKQLFIEDVINKMFEITEYNVTFNDIKDRKDDWYAQWTMTVEQNNIWKEWGISEIRKRFKYNKKWAEKEMGMIALMWGLKFSNFK
jgi:hypothetical protein